MLADIGRGLARLDDTLKGLDSRLRSVEQGQATVVAGLTAVADRTKAVEGSINDVVGKALGRLPSWWQIPAMLGACVGVLMGAAALVAWAARHGYLTF